MSECVTQPAFQSSCGTFRVFDLIWPPCAIECGGGGGSGTAGAVAMWRWLLGHSIKSHAIKLARSNAADESVQIQISDRESTGL